LDGARERRAPELPRVARDEPLVGETVAHTAHRTAPARGPTDA
jgi:hypothetical protein